MKKNHTPKPLLVKIKAVKFSKTLLGKTVEAAADVKRGDKPEDVLAVLAHWVYAQLNGSALIDLNELKKATSSLLEQHRHADRALAMAMQELAQVRAEVARLNDVKRQLEFEIPQSERT